MAGVLHCVGVGPGDPELLTLKAARVIASSPVVAFFAKRGQGGHARRIVSGRVPPNTEELRFEYPYTTELPAHDPRYQTALRAFYELAASVIANRLDAGRDVALLCEGDPFFYGSAMHVFDQLARAYPVAVIPGVTGMSGCWAEARLPMTHGDDVLTVLPGTMDEASLAARLCASDAAVIMKVGRNLPKIRSALREAGAAERAVYVARGTTPDTCVTPLDAVGDEAAPYFSLILVPGRQRAR